MLFIFASMGQKRLGFIYNNKLKYTICKHGLAFCCESNSHMWRNNYSSKIKSKQFFFVSCHGLWMNRACVTEFEPNPPHKKTATFKMLKTVVYSIKHSVLKNSTIKQKIRIREKKVFDFFLQMVQIRILRTECWKREVTRFVP